MAWNLSGMEMRFGPSKIPSGEKCPSMTASFMGCRGRQKTLSRVSYDLSTIEIFFKLQGLLEKKQTHRMTGGQCLGHSWLQQDKHEGDGHRMETRRIRRYTRHLVIRIG